MDQYLLCKLRIFSREPNETYACFLRQHHSTSTVSELTIENKQHWRLLYHAGIPMLPHDEGIKVEPFKLLFSPQRLNATSHAGVIIDDSLIDAAIENIVEHVQETVDFAVLGVCTAITVYMHGFAMAYVKWSFIVDLVVPIFNANTVLVFLNYRGK